MGGIVWVGVPGVEWCGLVSPGWHGMGGCPMDCLTWVVSQGWNGVGWCPMGGMAQPHVPWVPLQVTTAHPPMALSHPAGSPRDAPCDPTTIPRPPTVGTETRSSHPRPHSSSQLHPWVPASPEGAHRALRDTAGEGFRRRLMTSRVPKQRDKARGAVGSQPGGVPHCQLPPPEPLPQHRAGRRGLGRGRN